MSPGGLRIMFVGPGGCPSFVNSMRAAAAVGVPILMVKDFDVPGGTPGAPIGALIVAKSLACPNPPSTSQPTPPVEKGTMTMSHHP